MKELTAKEKLIISEWKTRQAQYEEAKHALREVLGKYGVASREFNTARVEFEMRKEEFDNFDSHYQL